MDILFSNFPVIVLDMAKKICELDDKFGMQIEETIERAMFKINERIDLTITILREFPLNEKEN